MATMPDSFFSWVVFLLNEYGGVLIQGAGVTLLLALVGTFIGCVIGLAVGIVQTIPEDPNAGCFKNSLIRGVKAVLSSYVEIFRGTPMIVQAMVVYYGAMSLFDIDMSAMFAGREAAVAIGMDHFQTMRFVVLPQALRNIMPQIGNNLIINIKDTSVLNVISVTELYFASKSAAGVYYRYFEIFFITCIIYFIMTFTASRILRRLPAFCAGWKAKWTARRIISWWNMTRWLTRAGIFR